MTPEERFQYQRQAFRKFIAEIEMNQLLDIADDIEKMLDYKADLIDSYIDRNKFADFMKAEWGIE